MMAMSWEKRVALCFPKLAGCPEYMEVKTVIGNITWYMMLICYYLNFDTSYFKILVF